MKRLLLVALITFSGIIGSFVSPFYGLCVYIWFAYMRAQEWARNVPWFVKMRPSLCLAVVIIVSSWIHREKLFRKNFTSLLMFLLWGWMLVSTSQAVNSVSAYFWMDYFTKLTILGFVMAGLLNSKRRLVIVIMVFVVALGFYSGKSGLHGILRPGSKILQGPGGMLKDNNSFAMAFNMILPFIYYGRELVPQKKFRMALLGLFVLSLFGVVFTYSRGGFLGLIVVASLITLRSKKKFIAFPAIMLAAFLFFLALPESYKERVYTIFDEKNRDGSVSGRLHFWKVAVIMANNNPIFGVGPGCYPSAYNRYDFSEGLFGKNRAVHQSFLQMLTDNGYPGLLLFLSLIIYSLFMCMRLRRLVKNRSDLQWVTTCANIFDTSIIAYCICASFLSVAYADFIYHLFFLVSALNEITRHQIKHSPVSIVLDPERDLRPVARVLARSDCGIVEVTNQTTQTLSKASYSNPDLIIIHQNLLLKRNLQNWKYLASVYQNRIFADIPLLVLTEPELMHGQVLIMEKPLETPKLQALIDEVRAITRKKFLRVGVLERERQIKGTLVGRDRTFSNKITVVEIESEITMALEPLSENCELYPLTSAPEPSDEVDLLVTDISQCKGNIFTRLLPFVHNASKGFTLLITENFSNSENVKKPTRDFPLQIFSYSYPSIFNDKQTFLEPLTKLKQSKRS